MPQIRFAQEVGSLEHLQEYLGCRVHVSACLQPVGSKLRLQMASVKTATWAMHSLHLVRVLHSWPVDQDLEERHAAAVSSAEQQQS